MGGYSILKETKHVIGFRESTKMIKQGRVESVTLATDTDEPLKSKILSLCKEYNIPVETVKSRRKLGYSCGIERPAAVVAYLK